MSTLTAFLRRPPIGWWDLADILVVSFLIYESLLLIRGTRAAQMTVGGGVLLGLFYGSRWGHLETVNWLIRNLAPYLMFSAIVLFQSDIRRALAHLGRAPVLRYFAKRESAEESIEELVVAATMLAADKIGAIIVLERQIGLRNYIDGGIPLDAVVTYDLLVSIFQRSTPLHDGAVIVRDDRVAAAACFLPLTVNAKLSKALGSRHRAAIGLTEENDSVAIVVSEETGRISIVVEGQIEPGLDADSLRARLHTLVLRRRPTGKAPEVQSLVKRLWPFHHFWLKVLALGLAVSLWVVVSGEAVVERGLRVPLELQRFPPDLELRTEVPSTVEIRVRGGSGTLSRLSAADIVAVIDLGGTQLGQRLFALTPDQVRAPFGVDIAQITPPTIAMVFEKSVTKAVTVVPVIEGKPAPGFVVGKITSDPENVDIVGPETAVKRAATAITEPVSIAGARTHVRGAVTVGVLDAALRLKTVRSAMVDVDILAAPLERTFRTLPVHWRNLSPQLIAEIMPSTVDLRVRGERDPLSHVSAMTVSAYVDVMGLGAGQYSLPVRADVGRADVGVSEIEPALVQVQITRDKN